MASTVLTPAINAEIERLGRADLVVGIPSFRNATTIGHVTRAAQAGLVQYFADLRPLLVNSDAGSPDGTVGAVRADLAVRYLLDPFAEYKWGPYAGGGLTVRRDGARRARAGLMLVLGVEGRRAKRWTPALEFALGEGTRLALVLRRSRANGR